MKTKSICLFILLITQNCTSWAEDTKNNDPVFINGDKAHKNHCYKCHDDQMYTRDNPVVKSISALGQQVRRCKDGNGIPWFDEDTDAVIHFLNKKYYKF